MKKQLIIYLLGPMLVFTSCGDQHKAQSLIKDFLKENLKTEDCSFETFGRLSRTAMIDTKRIQEMRRDTEGLPTFKKGIDYHDNAPTDTLLYMQATYKLTESNGKEKEYKQTFYMDKALTRVVVFKEY